MILVALITNMMKNGIIIATSSPNEVPVEVLQQLYEGLVRHAALHKLVLCQGAAAVLVQGIKQLSGSFA